MLSRNKITRFYFTIAVLGAVLFSILLLLLDDLRTELKFHVAGLTLYAVGAPIYIYSVYSFSWEGNHIRLFLNNHKDLIDMVENKIRFNQLTSFLLFCMALLIFNFHLDRLTFKMLWLSFLYNASLANILTLYLTSFQLRKIDLFENRFEIVRQPSVHLLIVILTASIFILSMVLLFYFSFVTGPLLWITLLFISSYFFLKPITMKKIVFNLKRSSYDPNR
jgi:hypothetical protein